MANNAGLFVSLLALTVVVVGVGHMAGNFVGLAGKSVWLVRHDFVHSEEFALLRVSFSVALANDRVAILTVFHLVRRARPVSSSSSEASGGDG